MLIHKKHSGKQDWATRMGKTVLLVFLAGGVILSCNHQPEKISRVVLSPNLEDSTEDGSPYNPSTQSFLRGYHWLDSVKELAIHSNGARHAHFELLGGAENHHFELRNVALDYLVPRLHYVPSSPPDAFDAFNLMLAEYSRNGMNIAVGEPGDPGMYFQTDLVEARPWTLAGSFHFVPNSKVRPIRFSIVNNCLASGLWELIASDRAGELYHSWFQFPGELYYQRVAAVNGVGEAFAQEALKWRLDPVEIDLDRLRQERGSVGEVPVSLAGDSEVGYSSQGSRRKLAKGFVLVEEDGHLRRPVHRSELTALPVHLAEFVEPGKYSLTSKRRFELGFLAQPRHAKVSRVDPLTRYGPEHQPPEDEAYIEIDLQLEGYRIILGNLPLGRLVQQEDFAMNGFGVGVLPASHLAERRQLLFKHGPAPSYAYLVHPEEGHERVLNSHEYGIEQIFIRTHSLDEDPWWEVTITSYERIIDLVKYRVEIPEALRQPLRERAERYSSPVYLTYRDDRIR